MVELSKKRPREEESQINVLDELAALEKELSHNTQSLPRKRSCLAQPTNRPERRSRWGNPVVKPAGQQEEGPVERLLQTATPRPTPKVVENLAKYLRTEMNYLEPPWGGHPNERQGYFTFLMKLNNQVTDILEVHKNDKQSFVVLGRHESVNKVVKHNSVSRFHAIIQPNTDGKIFVWDLNSSHGTFIWRIATQTAERLECETFVHINPGDVIKFGLCPTEFHLTIKSDPDSDVDVDRSICWDYVYGRCKKGMRCNWKHAFPTNPNYKVPRNIVGVWEKRNNLKDHFQARFAQICAEEDQSANAARAQ